MGLVGGAEKSGHATSNLGKRSWEGIVKTDSVKQTAGKDSHPAARECGGIGSDATSSYFLRAFKRLSTALQGDEGHPNPERGGGVSCARDRKILVPHAPSKRDCGGNKDSSIPLKPSNSTPGGPFQSVFERARLSTPELLAIPPNSKSGNLDIDCVLPKKPSIPLTPEQNKVLRLVLDGRNVFFTGPAGSGKSLILEHVKYHLMKQNKRFVITAPTGIAAAQLGGSTIHSWSGVGLGQRGLREYVRVATARHTLIGDEKEEWRKIQVLIIDEISMVSIKWAGKRWIVPF